MSLIALSTVGSTAIAILVALVFIAKLFSSSQSSKRTSQSAHVSREQIPEAVSKLINKLKSVVPEHVILSRDATARSSATGHWAQQECETTPACVAQPRDTEQLSAIVRLLRDEHDELDAQRDQLGTRMTAKSCKALFAVRGGGHSAVAGAASIKGGLVIDLRQFNEVKISIDRASVVVGAGAKWRDVYTLLDSKGLAVVGGRNADVGVGGLILGGGISFFSPRFGLVCSNVLEYEIVLATGVVTSASATANPDLWKALKGGANNFGIVTRFTLRCFPCSGVWAGFLYMLGIRYDKVLTAFHEAVAKADPSLPTHDKHAAGPIACFTYIQGVPFEVTSVSLAYTATSHGNQSEWPAHWRSSRFSSFWRIWSTVKCRSLTDATEEMNALNPSGRRQVLAGITVKNDPATLDATYCAYKHAQASVQRVKGITWTLVMQPLVPEWACKGDPNPLGLDEGSSEPLVVIEFTVVWKTAEDDSLVRSETKRTLEEIERFAKAHGTDHRYHYLNYCADWQDPLMGYGEENLQFLRDVSKRYDPSGLFQTGCPGGFKLWD